MSFACVVVTACLCILLLYFVVQCVCACGSLSFIVSRCYFTLRVTGLSWLLSFLSYSIITFLSLSTPPRVSFFFVFRFHLSVAFCVVLVLLLLSRF